MNDQYISYEDYQRACELNDFDRNCTCGIMLQEKKC